MKREIDLKEWTNLITGARCFSSRAGRETRSISSQYRGACSLSLSSHGGHISQQGQFFS